MAIAVAGNGSAIGGIATCNPVYVDTASAGNLLLIPVATGNATDTAPSAPSGYNAITNGHGVGGSGAYGTDTGNRMSDMFWRLADGTEDLGESVAVNNGAGSGTTRTTLAHILRLTKSLANWEIAATNGNDNTSGTDFSCTGAADPGFAAGDLAVIIAALAPDNVGNSGNTLSIPGCTLGTLSQQRATGTTNGADVRFITCTCPINSGTSSGAPTFATTGALDYVGGATTFVRIREAAAAAVARNPNIISQYMGYH